MEKRLSSMVLGKIPKSVMEEDEEEGGEASTGADNGNDAAEDAVEEGGNWLFEKNYLDSCEVLINNTSCTGMVTAKFVCAMVCGRVWSAAGLLYVH